MVFASERIGKVKRVSTMSEEQRKAAGIRLQTARASKYGLTIEQYRELHLRPGKTPTADDLARVKGMSRAFSTSGTEKRRAFTCDPRTDSEDIPHECGLRSDSVEKAVPSTAHQPTVAGEVWGVRSNVFCEEPRGSTPCG